MTTIGEKIRELRKNKNISQETLAFDVGVSRQTIHKWENDVMQPSTDNLKALGDYFNVDINYFFNDSGSVVINELAMASSKPKTKIHLAIGIVAVVIVSLMFIISLAFTIGIGFIAFTNNRVGHDYVILLETGTHTFYLFLTLSMILLSIDIIFIIFLIKKKKCA